MGLVNNTYIHKLAGVYHDIDKRGILVDSLKRDILDSELKDEITRLLHELSKRWNCHVYLGADNDDGSSDSINVNSSSGEYSLVKSLARLGYDVPKIRRANKQQGTVEYKDSANDEALQKLYAATSDLAIKHLLDIKELGTLRSRYTTARLFKNIWFSSYNVAGTETGRRSSKKHIFGYGNNAQNLPTHTSWAPRFLECMIARPGKLLFKVDQMSAEEWPVGALSFNHKGIQELIESCKPGGLSRHAKLASAIFNIPIEKISKKSIEYYLGKKSRHANNYGLQPPRFSQQCAAEGFSISVDNAKGILKKVNELEPLVDSVYHAYIKEQLLSCRVLRTPLGRERVFFGLRDNDHNYEVINKAYAYIPQSTVGDNTGLAVLYLENLGFREVLHENHDSISKEIPDTIDDCIRSYHEFTKSFDRIITFHNGIDINIPIEGSLGYDFANDIKIYEWSEAGVEDAYKKLREKYACPKELAFSVC